jgi:hypothetical protein
MTLRIPLVHMKKSSADEVKELQSLRINLNTEVDIISTSFTSVLSRSAALI